jgi:hypothetical protein
MSERKVVGLEDEYLELECSRGAAGARGDNSCTERERMRARISSNE